MNKVGARFLAKTTKLGGADACWFWEGTIDHKGYGRITVNGRSRRAHRIAYLLYIGAIPEGLVLDHKCRNRWCVNPRHLEPVTGRVNTLRGESTAAQRARRQTCPKGHPLGGDNLYIRPDRNARTRECKTCKRANAKASRERLKKEGDTSFPYGALAEEEHAA